MINHTNSLLGVALNVHVTVVCTNSLQLLKLYEEEMKDVVSLVEQAEVTDTRVSDYLRGLKSISEVYNKVCSYIV